MGGSITGMGIRHFFSAEFNFFLDAHAAKIVIDVGFVLFVEIQKCGYCSIWFCAGAIIKFGEYIIPRYGHVEGQIHKRYLPGDIKKWWILSLRSDCSGSSIQPWAD